MTATTLTRLEYRCDNGHRAESPKPLKRCPVCVQGKPCPAELKRVGTGSRKA